MVTPEGVLDWGMSGVFPVGALCEIRLAETVVPRGWIGGQVVQHVDVPVAADRRDLVGYRATRYAMVMEWGHQRVFMRELTYLHEQGYYRAHPPH